MSACKIVIFIYTFLTKGLICLITTLYMTAANVDVQSLIL